MKKTPGVALAVDECCAVEVVDNKYRIIVSKKKANAYKIYWKKEKFYHEVINKDRGTAVSERFRSYGRPERMPQRV